MSTETLIILLVVIVLIFGGGAYQFYPRTVGTAGPNSLIGILVLIIVIALILRLFGIY